MDIDILAGRLAELEQRVGKLEKRLNPERELASRSGKKISSKEFLITKNPRKETQKALALAYYLEHMEGMPCFNVRDLEEAFRSAREKVPKNVNDVINKNIARGFLMQAKENKDGKKAWHLTSTGERHVEETMC